MIFNSLIVTKKGHDKKNNANNKMLLPEINVHTAIQKFLKKALLLAKAAYIR